MGKPAVLAMQLHGVLTCVCNCVAKNACLPLPGEIKLPQTTQNCRDDGKSSAAISGTDLTLRVRYFPRQPRTPVLPRRPPDLWSTSYPTGRTRWHLQMPVSHHRVTTKKIQRRGAAHATLLHLVFLSKGAAESATGTSNTSQLMCSFFSVASHRTEEAADVSASILDEINRRAVATRWSPQTPPTIQSPQHFRAAI